MAPASRTGLVRDSERQPRQCHRLCLARRLGAPIDSIVLAHNENRTVPDYLQQGVLRPRPSVATLSSAMDVGNPSNLERLIGLFPDPATLRAALRAVSIDDEATRERIRIDYRRYGRRGARTPPLRPRPTSGSHQMSARAAAGYWCDGASGQIS